MRALRRWIGRLRARPARPEVMCAACGTGYRPRRWATGHDCNSY